MWVIRDWSHESPKKDLIELIKHALEVSTGTDQHDNDDGNDNDYDDEPDEVDDEEKIEEVVGSLKRCGA